jgi:hypothetical protein
MDDSLILPYSFCIFNKAIVHFYHVSGVVSEDVRFYSKQNFTAYLRRFTYRDIRDCDENELTNNIYALAKVALYDEPCDLISDGEYVQDDQNDEFVCFVDNVETNAATYLEENNVTYSYDGSTTLQFAHWK